jgi:hypothetical protein
MKTENIIKELERYRVELTNIMERFTRSSNGVYIRHEDDPHFRTLVIEITDLINDSIGENTYSPLINQIFNEGISNFLQSPSYKSVEGIVSVLDSVVTRLKRNPELFNLKKEDTPIGTEPIAYPEKITLKWLYAHVPYRFWSYLLSLLIGAFIFGTIIGNTQLYKSFIAPLITPNANRSDRTTSPPPIKDADTLKPGDSKVLTFTSGGSTESGRQMVNIIADEVGQYTIKLENANPTGSGYWILWDYISLRKDNTTIWEIGEDEAPPDYSKRAYDEFCDFQRGQNCTNRFTVGLTNVGEFSKTLNDGIFPNAEINFTITKQNVNSILTLVLSTLESTHGQPDHFRMRVTFCRI